MDTAINTILSALALWFAYLAYRKSFWIGVKLIEVNGAASISLRENNGVLFRHYTISIRNLGLPLHDVSVELRFDTPDQKCSIMMQPVKYREEHNSVNLPNEFAHGMIGTFTLRSHFPHVREFLRSLDCPRKRNARIAIVSQGYLAAEIPLWCRFYWLRSKWNRIARRFNSLFDKSLKLSDGSDVVSHRRILPLNDTEKHWQFLCFVRGMATEKQSDTSA